MVTYGLVIRMRILKEKSATNLVLFHSSAPSTFLWPGQVPWDGWLHHLWCNCQRTICEHINNQSQNMSKMQTKCEREKTKLWHYKQRLGLKNKNGGLVHPLPTNWSIGPFCIKMNLWSLHTLPPTQDGESCHLFPSTILPNPKFSYFQYLFLSLFHSRKPCNYLGELPLTWSKLIYSNSIWSKPN